MNVIIVKYEMSWLMSVKESHAYKVGGLVVKCQGVGVEILHGVTR